MVRAGYNFNHPIHIGHVATSAAASKVKDIMASIQFSGSPNVVLDTVKRGEDDSDVTSTPIKRRDFRNVILRIYEAYGGKGKAKVSTYCKSSPHANDSYLPVRRAFRTNILEDDGDEIDITVSQRDGQKISDIEVVVKPFEMVTLRLEV